MPPSLRRSPWLVASSGNENGHIDSWWPPLGGSILGLLLHSFILSACRPRAYKEEGGLLPPPPGQGRSREEAMGSYTLAVGCRL